MAVSTIDPNGLNVGQFGNRNLIINGDMQVAQRGTSATAFSYATVDRWAAMPGSTSTLAITQEPTDDAPSGFGKSYKITTDTAETMSGSKQLAVFHAIEAQNLQQLGYGTANAQSITVSFWVKSSVTGAYCLSLYENDDSRNIGATYTINSANTWEYKTITFPPDTVGVIDNNNGAGLETYFFLSVGPDRKTTDNTSWATWSAARFGYGQVADVAGTTNATWQITGVQLEVGDTATPFEHRSYGDELARCQRYYHKYGSTLDGSTYQMLANGFLPTTSRIFSTFAFSPPMRTQPTMSTTGTPANYAVMNANANTAVTSGPSIDGQTSEQTVFLFADTGATMTAGQGAILRGNGTSAAFLGFDAEL